MCLKHVEVLLFSKQRPEITLTIGQHQVKFWCDTGASKKVVRPDDVPNVLSSVDAIFVKAANGQVHKEQLSEHVQVKDEKTGLSCKCQVVLSCVCLRALLTALNIAIIPCDDGLRAQRLQEIAIMEGYGEPHYWYSLDLVNIGPASVTTSLIEKAKQKAAPHSDFMNLNDLHCTMYYKYTSGSDTEYERHFMRERQNQLTIKTLYWDKKGCVGASCELKPNMKKFYRSTRTTHISLAKPRDMEWADVGILVTMCEEACDWKRIDETTEYNETLQVFVSTLQWVTQAKTAVHLQGHKKQNM